MKKYIHVTREDRQFLAKAFGVSDVTVWKALKFEGETDTIRKIQHVAKQRGGIVMVVAPEMETLHDHDGVMRQYFPNGALAEFTRADNSADVIFKGKTVRHYEQVMISDMDGIQQFAAALK